MSKDWQFTDPPQHVDPALSKALDSVAGGRADRLYILEANGETNIPLTYQGFKKGVPLLQAQGRSPFAVGQTITNGAIQKGTIAQTNIVNQTVRINGIPRVAVETIPTTTLTKGKIKYLYSIVKDGIKRFYVGGWQQKSVLVKELPLSQTVYHASIDNLGKDDWSVNLSYKLTTTKTAYAFINSNSKKSWIYEYTSSGGSCFGNGFWSLGRETATSSSPIDSESGGGIEYVLLPNGTVFPNTTSWTRTNQDITTSGNNIYLWQNQRLTSSYYSNRHENLYGEQTEFYVPVGLGAIELCTTNDDSRVTTTTSASIVLPNPVLSLTSTGTRTQTSYSKICSISGEQSQDDHNESDSSSGDFNGTVPIKVNQYGNRAVGNKDTNAYWATPDGLEFRTPLFSGLFNYLDVQISGLSLVDSEFFIKYVSTPAEAKAGICKVKLFDPGFKQKIELRTYVYKPDQFKDGLTYSFYNASYHS